MRVLALSFFDPASVVLSHRDLMRAQGHDFRLAVVRAYTERQRQADYVIEQLVAETTQLSPGVSRKRMFFERLAPDLEGLQEFAASADVIQFHPGIGRGDGDWASQDRQYMDPIQETIGVVEALGLGMRLFETRGRVVYFFHGSRAVWANLNAYKQNGDLEGAIAASTIDYATELGAAYLPPLVYAPDTLHAPLRQDDDPLVIAHTPTDRIACSTDLFLEAARGAGAVVRLGEGISHDAVLTLKAECNAGFDHLRGAFSMNTLENAAIGLAPLAALKDAYLRRMAEEQIVDNVFRPIDLSISRGGRRDYVRDAEGLGLALKQLSEDPESVRWLQRAARIWWQNHFSAAPITKRLLKFYEGL